VYSTVVSGYRVTAVGEVPPQTVRAIARSVQPGAGEPLGITVSAEVAFPALDVNGAGSLLIVGGLGSGGVDAASGGGLVPWPMAGPYRADLRDGGNTGITGSPK
jgi:hypothetical protein